MELEETLLRVQAAYPRIYLACHSRHSNARSTAERQGEGARISPRDASLLAHLDGTNGVAQSDLARHMAVAKSTLSEALASLEERGFVARQPDDRDCRGSFILRTAKGTAAMSSGSVLEPERLRRMLETLSGEERHRAVEGLELIARAGERVTQCQ